MYFSGGINWARMLNIVNICYSTTILLLGFTSFSPTYTLPFTPTNNDDAVGGMLSL